MGTVYTVKWGNSQITGNRKWLSREGKKKSGNVLPRHCTLHADRGQGGLPPLPPPSPVAAKVQTEEVTVGKRELFSPDSELEEVTG